MDETDLLDVLADWLKGPLGERPELTSEGKPGSGFSAENLVLAARTSEGTRRLVLRRDSTDAPIYPGQAPGLTSGIGFQRLVMEALAGQVPVAEVLGGEAGESLLGVPFFVMEYVEGQVPIENPPCTQEGFYAELPPASRTAMVTDGLEVLAALHGVPWRGTDLVCLDPTGTTPGAGRQLDVWSESLLTALAGRTSPLIERALAFLGERRPPDPGPDDVLLSWGDARLGNMIWRDDRCVCVTDFEGTALAEPALDVGWWLMADRWMHEGSGIDRLPGEPTRAEQVAIYERAAGRTLPELGWYEAFAALRFATTVVHVMNRLDAQGIMPEGHTIWRDNPATEVLLMILEEVGG